MVLTIEPGMYVRPSDRIPREFWNIGIRIEDDAIVTAGGCELISRGVPVQAGRDRGVDAGVIRSPGEPEPGAPGQGAGLLTKTELITPI